MRFSELLDQSGVAVSRRRGDADVTSVVADSRRCEGGACFVAVRGSADDGHRYIAQAVAAGAAAVVCEDPAGVPPEVALAVVGRSQTTVGCLAQAFHGWPGRRLTSVAVTGTNGKTTVAYLLRSILTAAGEKAAMLGTVCYQTGRRTVEASTTTPDAIQLAQMAAEMVDAGMTHLVMEMSSHALDQGRASGMDFRVGVFTNLSGDHLDYHGSMESYRDAKRRLFEGLPADGWAVVNRDDLASEAMAAATGANVFWYGLSPLADLHAQIDRIDADGTRMVLVCGDERSEAFTPLIGRHNVYNCLAAAGAAKALGLSAEAIVAGLAQAGNVPGRLERVDVPAPYSVFVDYAHTDDALTNILGAVRPVTAGRVILVFGCGGDRDRTKRPRMARVAEDLADRVVVTSDNPRTERPEDIIEEILTGLTEQGRAEAIVEPDRRRAITEGIGLAERGDVVIIAGKGHENYQVLGTERVHFDDAEVATEVMRARGVSA